MLRAIFGAVEGLDMRRRVQRWRRRAARAFVVAAVLLMPLTAGATSAEVVSDGPHPSDSKVLPALPPRAADRAARRDLLSVLQPIGKFSNWFGNVATATFVTWPYRTQYLAVCREDRLTVAYNIANFKRGGNVRNYSYPEDLATQPLFHVDRLPVPDKPGMLPICYPHHPDANSGWFAASTARDAARAVNLFYMAEDQVKAGKLTPNPCPPLRAKDCREWFTTLDNPSKIMSVDACASSGVADACYVISLFVDAHVTVQLTVAGSFPSGYGPTGDGEISPTAITSIKAEEVMTIIE